MLKHNFLLIYRNFKRFKSTFFINLIGLSTGLACALLIYLWVNDELNVDKFHSQGSQLYQVMENDLNSNGIRTQDRTPDLLAETMAAELPEVDYATAVLPASAMPSLLTISANNVNVKAAGQFASKDFFNIFSYPLLEGNKDKVLADKNGIVLSEDLAMKLFHTTKNVVGRTMQWQLAQFKKAVLVTGIFKKLPANSSAQFDLLLTDQAFRDPELFHRTVSWDNHAPATYLVLKKGTNIDQFNKKIAGYLKTKASESTVTLFVRPFSDSYLYGTYKNGVQAGGRIEYVNLFSIIAIFILVIACINFMNLSTAKASVRLKEVGVKKAIGASRGALVSQYMGESMFMAFLSLLVAVLLVVVLLPTFNDITQKHLSLHLDVKLMLAFLAITLLTGIISGSYPSLYLSGFNPITVLKGGSLSQKLSNSVGEVWTRQGLVVFQFALSVILIVSVQVVYRQISYVQSKNLGFKKDNVIYFSKEGKIAENTEAFLAEVKKIPGVINASGMEQSIIGSQGGTVGLDWKGKNPKESIRFINITVDYDAIETLGMHMKYGRSFSRKFGADSTNIIFNEAAIKAMGLTNPVGQTVQLWGQNRQIVGVVSDFNFESLHDDIKPVFMKLNPSETMTLMTSIETGKQPETIAKLHQIYQAFNPGYSLEYKFLDQDFQAQYVSEQRVSILSRYFAGLAILISCLGLFGLAAFTAERRNKEIGIRKVLGASVAGIIALLSRDFIKLVAIAIVVALPIAYYFMHNWLQSFAYRIDIQWWALASVAVLVMGIALLTVSFQSIKAALMNPVKSLRSE
ncbi:ABC transporter permease [Spirosoma flavum]|uniref:ABC transporter permease n=1 Tax=Spirosoma flavum TaxID=2048557 RepID=A0ABW6AK96_9BACT